MRCFIILLLCVIMFSCGKSRQDDPVLSDKFLLVQNHNWIRDSFYTYFPDDTTVAYASDAPDDTIVYKFTADKYIFSDFFGKDTSSLAYENPDKIYFWSPKAQRNDSTYFTLLAVDNYNIIFRQIRFNNIAPINQVFYCHAQR